MYVYLCSGIDIHPLCCRFITIIHMHMQAAASVNVGVEGLAFGWRVSLGFQFLYVLIMFIGFPLLPESPRCDSQCVIEIAHQYFCYKCRWLIKKNKLQKAHKVLSRIYEEEDEADSCMRDISASIKDSSGQKHAWKACLSLDFLQR